MKTIHLITFGILALFFLSFSAHAVTAGENGKKSNPQSMVAGLTDEQARQLLIKELEKQIVMDMQAASSKEKSRLVVFIHHIKNRVAAIQARIDFLKSGGSAKPEAGSGLFAYLAKHDLNFNPLRTVVNVLIIFAIAFIIEGLFYSYSRPLRAKAVKIDRITLLVKLWNQSLKALIDLMSTAIFIVAAIFIFLIFFEKTPGLRLLFTTYLTVVVIIHLTVMILKFFLAPNDPDLRFLPINTSIANYLHHWITAIVIVASSGILTCGIMKITGTSEIDYIKSLFLVSCIISSMIIIMILQKRKTVEQSLSTKFPRDNRWGNVAHHWHHAAIFFVVVLLAISTINVVLGDYDDYAAMKTLAIVPAYFLLDWFLINILNTLFDLIPQEKAGDDSTIEKKNESETQVLDTKISDVKEPVENDKPLKTFLEINRIKKTLADTLRIALFLLFLIWILNFWGVNLPIGEAFVRAVFDVLVVLLVFYVIWALLNVAIQRKIALEMPEHDEDMEEGGSGGSRIGTLLVLLKKFFTTFIVITAIIIILSEMGINIAPLLAGAGVIGLAVGFGSQTLVKDIISGIFFLIDDAFRVGDYIEVGSNKGMVEQISLRSFKLRHPRGMLNTIPFGSIGTVANFSRDYIITKLNFRVRYDTDVEKVRKIVKKKVYKKILENEELASKLLGKIKSQGVRQMDDSAMIMRIKFKSIPGEQFVIRKEVFRLLQEAFKEEGIEFAHKNVTVYIPPETNISNGESDDAVRKKKLAAGAAAAAAAETIQKKTTQGPGI